MTPPRGHRFVAAVSCLLCRRHRLTSLALVSFLMLLLFLAQRVVFWHLCGRVSSDGQHDLAVRPTSSSLNRSDLNDGPSGAELSTPTKSYDLFQLGPFRFLDNFRNPCWQTSANGTLACLPFFFLAGFPKCGTTELYRRIKQHPHVAGLPDKEPHWLTRKRYQNTSFAAYTNLMAKSLLRKRAEPLTRFNPRIVGDASVSTVWDNDRWYLSPGNSKCSEPCVIHADYLRHLVPGARIIIILRNPTLRLYSDFNFFNPNGSKQNFHELIVKQSNILSRCFKQFTLRYCVYNRSLNDLARVRLGLYHVFLEDWFRRFPRDQIHVLRLDELAANTTRELLTIYRFLGLGEVLCLSYYSVIIICFSEILKLGYVMLLLKDPFDCTLLTPHFLGTTRFAPRFFRPRV